MSHRHRPHEPAHGRHPHRRHGRHDARPTQRTAVDISPDDDEFIDDDETDDSPEPPRKARPASDKKHHPMRNFRLDRSTISLCLLAAIGGWLGWQYLTGNWRGHGVPPGMLDPFGLGHHQPILTDGPYGDASWQPPHDDAGQGLPRWGYGTTPPPGVHVWRLCDAPPGVPDRHCGPWHSR